MKNTGFKLISLVMALMLLSSCHNRSWEFDDFDYTATYFPWTFPVRTLVLGDCDYNNTNDKNHQFVISAAMGGVFENTTDIAVDFTIDPTLVENLAFEDSTAAKILPEEYYTLSNPGRIVIPKGKFNGGVTVTLTDAFFRDPEACTTRYVLPLRILSATTDSVLRGSEAISDPDPRIAAHWKKAPMDFTVFGIKYINEYHGNYLLRGKTLTWNDDSEITGKPATYGYGKYGYIEEGIVTPLLTRSLSSLEYSQQIQVSEGTSPGLYTVILTVHPETGEVTVAPKEGSPFGIRGTGKYVKGGQEWGGKKRNALYLDLTITDHANRYEVQDTLVFRDNKVKTEEFTPVIL